MIKIIYILVLLLLFPNDIKAINDVFDPRCTNSLKTALREEAMDFTYRLSKSYNNDEIVYTSYFYNLSNNIDIIDENGNKYNRNQLDNLKQGSTLTITLVSSNNNYCAGYKLLTRVIRIPYYNKYYGTALCKGYENLSLCSENERVLYDEDEFTKVLNNYKEETGTKDEKDEENIKEEKEEFSMYVFLSKYKYYICGAITLVFISIVMYKIRKKVKNKGIL